MTQRKSHSLVDSTVPNYIEDTFDYDLPPLIKLEDYPVVEYIDGEPAEFVFNSVKDRDIVVTDTTFRDGQQARPPYTVDQMVTIYDMLARSVSGDLLTDIFLETKRSLVLANQGGAQAKVKEVSLDNLSLKPFDENNRFSVEANWTVHGSVGHWGHVHRRSNRYQAILTLAVDGKDWKLNDMTVLQEERL